VHRSDHSGEVEAPTVSAREQTWRQSAEPAAFDADEEAGAVDDEVDDDSDFELDESDEDEESDDDDEVDDDFDLPPPRLSVL
jgi:hypothetical protein